MATDKINMDTNQQDNLNSGTENTANSGEIFFNKRQQKTFYSSNFPQPCFLGYGWIRGNGTFDELNATPFYNLKHQPIFWTCSRTAAGSYRVTHNLGNLTYMPLFTNSGGNTEIIQLTNLTLNYFEFQTYVAGGTPTDTVVALFLVYGLP